MSIEKIETPVVNPSGTVDRRNFLRLGVKSARGLAAAAAFVTGSKALIYELKAEFVVDDDDILDDLGDRRSTVAESIDEEKRQIQNYVPGTIRNRLDQDISNKQSQLKLIDGAINSEKAKLQPAIDAFQSRRNFWLKYSAVAAVIAVSPSRRLWEAISGFATK